MQRRTARASGPFFWYRWWIAFRGGAAPRCARYPRMAWIYGFLRRGSLAGYPRMAWIYGFLRCGSLPRYPRMAWIYGFCVAGHCRGRICANNRRSTPCVDALRSGVMNPGGVLRPGLNVGRIDCAVVAGLRPALPRCARYPRMAWIYVFLRRGSLARYPRMAWIYGFLRRGSLARYPRMAWIYGVFASRVIGGGVSAFGVDPRRDGAGHCRGRCVTPRRSFGARVWRFRC